MTEIERDRELIADIRDAAERMRDEGKAMEYFAGLDIEKAAKGWGKIELAKRLDASADEIERENGKLNRDVSQLRNKIKVHNLQLEFICSERCAYRKGKDIRECSDCVNEYKIEIDI